MADCIEVRASMPRDLPAIETLYRDAFPDEDLVPLVNDLLRHVPVTLSLVGTIGSSVAGHVIFTTCRIAESKSKVALLGPLVVASHWQRKGIGSALIGNGLQRLKTEGFAHVYVLGDPAYYSAQGFVPEVHVNPPYPLPEAWLGAWQSMTLGNAEALHQGELSVPQPWQQPALWAP